MPLKIDRIAFFLVGLGLLFTLYLFDPDIGYSMGFFLFFAILAMMLDPKSDVTIEREYNPLRSVLIATIGTFAVWILSALYLQTISGIFSLNSAVQLFANMIPFFKGNLYFTWVAFALIIPVTETLAIWGPIQGTLMDWFHARYEGFKSPKLWGILIFLAFGFFALHLSAKQGKMDDLIPVLIMGTVTGAIVIYEKLELKSAILMHILLNSTSIIVGKFNLAFTIAIGVSLGVVVLLSYLTKYMRLESTLLYNR